MAEPTFTSLERDGWGRNAAGYADLLLAATSQAFAPLLDTFGDLTRRRLLDVASGTGHLAKAAADRGALAEGVDIAPEMVAKAAQGFPDVRFQLGNAEDLPYEDGAFDAVTCCFGILHLEHPDKAVAEVYCILRPGGRFSYTAWQSPDAGGELLGLILRVFKRLANMEVGLPPAPPMFQFAEAATRDRVLGGAGFTAISGRDLDIRWRSKTPEEIGRLQKEGLVRTRLIFERQEPAAQDRIIAGIVEEASAFRTADGIEIPSAAHLATATKAN